MINLDWLDSWINELPVKEEVRKNLIDIAGYPSWENVNSNLLAFYFDKSEEHGFGSLFIDSLLELINNEDLDFGDGDFSVAREVRTKGGKSIDLVITQIPDEEPENDEEEKTPPKWAVVLENKINHGLNNDLKDYWLSVTAEKKLGFVLSKFHKDLSGYNDQEFFKKNNIFYHSITHKQLTEKVQEKLFQCFIDADDRHLLFLKEYIANTKNFYNSDRMNEERNQVLQMFHNNKTNIIELKKQDRKLLEFITNTVVKIFKENNFKAGSTTISKGKHFFATTGSPFSEKVFRFYVDMNTLRYEDVFWAYYEIYGRKKTGHGSTVKKYLEEHNVFTNYLLAGTGGNDRSAHQHIYTLKIPIGDFSKIGLEEALRNALNTHFWNHHNNFLFVIEEAYKSALNQDGK